MKIAEGFYLKNILGSNIVVPFGENTINFNGMINLNDSGAFLWKKLESSTTEDELLQAIIQEYEIDENTAKRDIDLFISALRNAEILE